MKPWRPWRALLCAVCWVGLPAGSAWAADTALLRAWRGYSVCVAASMEDAAVRDMGEAQLELPQGRRRLPVPTWALVELAKKGCQPLRETLAQAYEQAPPQERSEPLVVQEARLFQLLQGYLLETQKSWQARGLYDTVSPGNPSK